MSKGREFWLSEAAMSEAAWKEPHNTHRDYKMIRWIPAEELTEALAQIDKLEAALQYLWGDERNPNIYIAMDKAEKALTSLAEWKKENLR